MPRRASSGLKPGLLIGIASGGVVLLAGGSLMLSSGGESEIEGTRLEMSAVTENANSLRGNSYVVEGKIDEKLRWTADSGQVVSLEVGDRDPEYLAIEIPAALSAVNIEREQPYAFRVRFRQGGIAVAEEIVRR